MTTELDFDIIIVGSGAGGGTVASELASLARDGLRVAVFESGGEFKAADNTQNEYEMASRYYVDSGGIMNTDENMTFALAKAIGGSTTVYTGTSLVMPERVVRNWGIPDLTSEDLAPRYSKYKAQNNVHCLDESELNQNNLLFRKACKSLNWKWEQFPLNVKGCTGLGTCNLGCARQSKQGTNVVQLPHAEENGIKIYSWAEVLSIQEQSAQVRVHPPKFGLAPSSLPPGDYLVHFDKIVIAAGAFGTPALLQNSGGFDHLDALGRYFTCHPSLMVAGKHSAPIDSQVGHPKSFCCDEFLESKRFLLETCMYYPFTFTKNLWGFGSELESFINPFNNLQMILAFAIDEPNLKNRVSFSKKAGLKIDYEISKNTKQALTESMHAAAEILFESGVESVHLPTGRDFLIHRDQRADLKRLISGRRFDLTQFTLSAAHLMGTCRMGTSLQDSVTDSWGRVHEHPDVYIADASLFPMPSEVNPYLTVMALADRVSEGIKNDLGV